MDWFRLALADELDFTSMKIYQNFSNYSAWHRRSRVLPMVHAGAEALEAAIAADLKTIKAAYFTEPADQSAWFYLGWLLLADQHDFVLYRRDTWLFLVQPTAGTAALVGSDGVRLEPTRVVEHLPYTTALYACTEACVLVDQRTYTVGDLEQCGRRARARVRGELGNIDELLAIEPDAPLALFMWVCLAAQVGGLWTQIGSRLDTLQRLDPLRAGSYRQLQQQLGRLEKTYGIWNPLDRVYDVAGEDGLVGQADPHSAYFALDAVGACAQVY